MIYYPTEQAALDAAKAAGWSIQHDQHGTRCVWHKLSNRLVHVGSRGWAWLAESQVRP